VLLPRNPTLTPVFQMLVGEAFRRQGYAVEETGLGGADGGVDLILRKAGRTELVQCKQWQRQQISVSVVREMWGLAHHHRADALKIVCVGEFTRDAVGFADGKPIALISGEQLRRWFATFRRSAALLDPNHLASNPGLIGRQRLSSQPAPTAAAIWSAGPIDKAA